MYSCLFAHYSCYSLQKLRQHCSMARDHNVAANISVYMYGKRWEVAILITLRKTTIDAYPHRHYDHIMLCYNRQK